VAHSGLLGRLADTEDTEIMAYLRTIIWYAILLVMLLVLYHVGTSYRIAVVEEHFTYMQPTIDPKGIYLIDRRDSTRFSLSSDDIIAYRVVQDEEIRRTFGRVLARPGSTVSVRGERVVVDGRGVADFRGRETTLRTGLIVPRDTVFVIFDSDRAPDLPLSKRLVPYRDIIGRVMNP
jgi:hypothetical protein